jgi:hypothetical protein
MLPGGEWLPTAQNFIFSKYGDGEVFVHKDGKVDPSQYGGSKVYEFYLCFLVFCTNKVCSDGRFCRYRHAKLELVEVVAIALKGGNNGLAFLDRYQKCWPQPHRPVCSECPKVPAQDDSLPNGKISRDMYVVGEDEITEDKFNFY